MAIVGTKEKTTTIDIYRTLSGVDFEVNSEIEELSDHPDIIEEEVKFLRNKYNVDRMKRVFTSIVGEKMTCVFGDVFLETYDEVTTDSSILELVEGYGFDYDLENLFVDFLFQVIAEGDMNLSPTQEKIMVKFLQEELKKDLEKGEN